LTAASIKASSSAVNLASRAEHRRFPAYTDNSLDHEVVLRQDPATDLVSLRIDDDAMAIDDVNLRMCLEEM
jgi:hypothetical protein